MFQIKTLKFEEMFFHYHTYEILCIMFKMHYFGNTSMYHSGTNIIQYYSFSRFIIVT